VKIDNSVKSASGLPSSDGRTRGAKDSPKTQSSSGGSDKVDISSMSTRMKQMEETIASTPVVDKAKVDEIKQAISNGQFKVDTGKVADGLIQSVRQMLGAQASPA
jgi:negative regulator of flagellin synthesis FlgM